MFHMEQIKHRQVNSIMPSARSSSNVCNRRVIVCLIMPNTKRYGTSRNISETQECHRPKRSRSSRRSCDWHSIISFLPKNCLQHYERNKFQLCKPPANNFLM